MLLLPFSNYLIWLSILVVQQYSNLTCYSDLKPSISSCHNYSVVLPFLMRGKIFFLFCMNLLCCQVLNCLFYCTAELCLCSFNCMAYIAFLKQWCAMFVSCKTLAGNSPAILLRDLRTKWNSHSRLLCSIVSCNWRCSSLKETD